MNNTINVSIDCVPAALREFFAEHSTIALAFSGGTDSSYLLYAAKACGANVHAYYVSTPFQPQFELDDAKLLAESLHADMTVLPFDVLTDKVVKSNPKDRCYYCKNQVFGGILRLLSHMILTGFFAFSKRQVSIGSSANTVPIPTMIPL